MLDSRLRDARPDQTMRTLDLIGPLQAPGILPISPGCCNTNHKRVILASTRVLLTNRARTKAP